MQLNNYTINGKPLGFTKASTIGDIVTEVLSSYLPIKPNTCMLTGKPILTKPKIILVDGNPENILFSNIAIVSSEVDTNTSLQHEVIYKFSYRGVFVKCWKFDEFDFLNNSNFEKIQSYLSSLKTRNPAQIFLDLINLGVKGLVFVTVENTTDCNYSVDGVDYHDTVTESCHYQDLLKYRMLNPTNIVSA